MTCTNTILQLSGPGARLECHFKLGNPSSGLRSYQELRESLSQVNAPYFACTPNYRTLLLADAQLSTSRQFSLIDKVLSGRRVKVLPRG